MQRTSLLFLVLGLLFSSGLFGQTLSGDARTDLRSLRSLSDTEYIQTALDFAEQYTQQGNWSLATELLDAAVTKARRSGGKTAAATVHLEYVRTTLDCCVRQASAQGLAAESLVAAFELKENNLLNDRLEIYLRQLNANTSAPKTLTRLFSLADQMDPSGQLAAELKGLTLNEAEKRSLTKQSTALRSAVRAKEAELQNLSLTAARERALAEYHKKIADSLYYVGVIDSLYTRQREQALVEQAATIELQQSQLSLQAAESRTMKVVIGSALLGLLLLTGFFLQSKKLNRQLAAEKDHSEQLLLNILPRDVAEELKATGFVEPRFYELGTVLFTDFVGFSHIAKSLSSERLIKDLDECFQAFDRLAGEYEIEKIKTIGDSYMCIGGVPTPDAASVRNIIRFALTLQQQLADWNAGREEAGLPVFQARIGIHTGPVVAGVVGIKKFAYDIWGDTVNIASRMESQGAPGQVNVSAATYALVKNDFIFRARGAVEIKNMKPMAMYFVEGERTY